MKGREEGGQLGPHGCWLDLAGGTHTFLENRKEQQRNQPRDTAAATETQDLWGPNQGDPF